jgi:hypothetical protein
VYRSSTISKDYSEMIKGWNEETISKITEMRKEWNNPENDFKLPWKSLKSWIETKYLSFYKELMRFVFFSKSTKGIFSIKKRVKLVNHWSKLPYFNLTTTIKRVSHFQQDVRLNCLMKSIVIQAT